MSSLSWGMMWAGQMFPGTIGTSGQLNVVFIMGDDVGWADVPWNNRDLRSANTPDIITRQIYCTLVQY